MIEKVYVAYKPDTSPHLLVKWPVDGTFIDLTEQSGVTYFEDEIGFYYMSGELECSAE
jgi:alpha-glucosidase (family GH31 glycosyl hydrolase)